MALTLEQRFHQFNTALSELDAGNTARAQEFFQSGDVLTTVFLQNRNTAQAKGILQQLTKHAHALEGRAGEIAMARVEFRLAMIAQMERDEAQFFASARAAYDRIRAILAGEGEKPWALYFHICGVQARVLARSAVNRILPFFHEVSEEFDRIPAPSTEEAIAYAQFCHNVCDGLLSCRLNANAYAIAEKSFARLDALPQVGIALDVTAQLAALIGTAKFNDKDADGAIQYLGKALACTERLTDMQPHQKAARLAHHAFNLANTLFQFDRDEEAIPYFEQAIDTCIAIAFPACENILRYASDYYAQLLVRKHDYKGAVARYTQFLDFCTERKLESDFVKRTCANFCYRIAYVYAYFLCNAKQIEAHLARAKQYLDSVSVAEKSDLALRKLVEEGF